MNFNTFKLAVAKQFDRMQKHDLFRVDSDRDVIWNTYLTSFPEGANPVYRQRTEHDCSCCKQFIRNIGNVVTIIDDKVVSVWDISIPSEPAYQAVADALSVYVKSKNITDLFLHFERTAGIDKNFEQLASGEVSEHNHFFVNIATQFVKKNIDIPSALSIPRADYDVLLRSLNELTLDSIDTVLDLIAQNSLYRGEEHKVVVTKFRELKVKFNKLKTVQEQNIFTWQNSKNTLSSVARIRNTVIGSLLVDLAEGKDLEASVKSFEQKVAPTNYKRPTALITPVMIEKAKNQLTKLGLTSALERRFANINDITVNNILFANREARKTINGDVFDDLVSTTKTKVKNLDKIEEVFIEKFVSDILPRAESLEVLLENQHENNLVSLIAPVDPTAGNLFKWDNNFSWSYAGGVADSIKERVKKAGGNVTGDLCCRLAWDYSDDLDLHMYEPDGGHVYFGNRRHKSVNGGMLDVDANGGDGQREDPAENIFYETRKKMCEGVYTLKVVNYNRRSDGKGFEVEIEFDGNVHHIMYEKALRSSETISVVKIKYSKANGFEIIESLPSTKAVRSIWNMNTQSFHKVNVMMMSPNFWDEKAVSNKHYFFMLQDCINDGKARGFLNEFLKSDLDKHRKVFEVIGSKMKVESSENQLSGLGFSSTQQNALVVRVKGSITRLIKIIF